VQHLQSDFQKVTECSLLLFPKFWGERNAHYYW
jgi:hypothetical protein